MAVLSAFSIIRSLCVLHLAAAYFLLTSPAKVVTQNMVLVLGDAMQLPETRDFDRPNEATSFAGLILGILAITDFVAATLPDVAAVEYWLKQAPVRLAVLFGITAYPLLFKPGGYLGPQASSNSFGAGFASAIKRDRSPGELLINNLIFATGFFEVSIWFWIFILLKDERREVAAKIAKQKNDQIEAAAQK